MNEYIKIPKLNPIRILKADENFMVDSLPNHETKVNYLQKFQNSDNIRLQFHAIKGNYFFSATAYIKDVYGSVVKTILCYEKISNVVSDYTCFEINQTLSGIAEGIYFVQINIVKANNNDVILLSEPIHIKATHENTVLFEYYNDENEFDVIFDEALSHTVKFQLRVEGGFASDGFSPASKDTVYRNEIYDNVLLSSIPFATKKLTIGSSFGVPNWIIDIINRCFSCNNVKIDGLNYCKNDGSKLEAARLDKYYPFSGWIIDLVDSENTYSKTDGDEYDPDILFYPAVLTDKTILNLGSSYFNVRTYKILNINFTTKIVEVDYNVELPLFEESKLGLLGQTWQIHKKGIAPNGADNILQLKTQIDKNKFEFLIISGQNQSNLESTFTIYSSITFRNPYCFYNPLTFDHVISAQSGDGLPSVNRFPQTLINEKEATDLYKAICHYNNGVVVGNNGYSESSDFINWTNPVRLKINQPSWKYSGLDDYTYMTGQTNYIKNNKHIIPVAINNTSNVRRIAFMEVPVGFNSSDFNSGAGINVSTSYLTDSLIADTTNYEWVQACLTEFNGELYLSVDIYTISPFSRKVVIYKLTYTDIDHFSLVRVQEIVKSTGAGEYDSSFITYPNMFVHGNQLFMITHAAGSPDYIIPNIHNTNGLWEFNKDTGLFEEYFSNPIAINPLLQTDMTWSSQHTGNQIAIFDENADKILSLTTFNNGTNTYKVGAVELTKKAKKEVNNWFSLNR